MLGCCKPVAAGASLAGTGTTEISSDTMILFECFWNCPPSASVRMVSTTPLVFRKDAIEEQILGEVYGAGTAA